MWKTIGTEWTPVKRWSFLGLMAFTVLALTACWWWLQRPLTGTLFSDLAERDVAVIVAELDKAKVPYELGADGRSIRVAEDAVHKTRLQLMGKTLPLHGVVGFELFNHADFGASDFVQKVNYLRALQGELTRTILALDQVQDVRVHLALPEQQLFRKEQQRGKASVTLSLKPGQRLGASQVEGIQRLLAASVPDLAADDVAVLDQHGKVLSLAGGEDAVQVRGQLAAKKDMELALSEKANRLLLELYGEGAATVAVDVELNHTQVKVTTDEVLAPVAAGTSSAMGLLVKERTASKESPAKDGGQVAGSVQSTQEAEYRAGRRVEQSSSQGGQIARLNLAVLIKSSMPAEEQERIKALLATSVGFRPARGDTVTMHVLPAAAPGQGATKPAQAGGEMSAPMDRAAPVMVQKPAAVVPWVLAGLLGVGSLAAAAWWVWRRRPAARPALSAQQRQQLLTQVQAWLSAER